VLCTDLVLVGTLVQVAPPWEASCVCPSCYGAQTSIWLWIAFLVSAVFSDSGLKDEHGAHDCGCWAAQGQCEANEGFMHASCAASCAAHEAAKTCHSEKQELKRRLSEAKADDLKQKLQDWQVKYQELEKNYKLQEVEAKQKSAELQAQVKELNGKLELQMSSQASSCKAESAKGLQEKDDQLAKSKKQEEEARQKSAALQAQVEELNGKLENQISSHHSSKAELAQQLQEKDDQLVRSKMQEEEAKQKSNALQAQIVELNGKLENLMSSQASSKAEVTQQLQERDDQLVRSKVQEEEAKQKNIALQAQVEELNGKLELQMSSQASSCKAEGAQELQERDDQLAKSKKQEEEARQKSAALQAQVEELNGKLEELNGKLENQISSHTSSKAELAQQLQEKDDQLVRSQKQEGEAKQKSNALQAQVKELTGKLENLISSQASSKTEVTQQLQERDVQLVESKKQEAEAKQKSAALQAQIEELDRKLAHQLQETDVQFSSSKKRQMQLE